LAALKWSEVDLKWGRVTLHGKTDDRTIPLPPYCAHLIDALPRVPESDDKPEPLWVFASKLSASGYLHDPNRAHGRAFKSAGIPHLTLHGLRRSYTSLAEEDDLNPPAGVVAQLQGHRPSATIEKHYAKRTEEFLRQWSERIESWILRKGGVRFTPPKKKKVG
jgi:integrase